MSRERGQRSGPDYFGWGQLPYLARGCSLEELPDDGVDVAEAVVVSIEVARMRRELRRLPEPERRVLRWRYGIDGPTLSYRQIAEQLGLPQGSIWKIEQRALETLRTFYDWDEAA